MSIKEKVIYYIQKEILACPAGYISSLVMSVFGISVVWMLVSTLNQPSGYIEFGALLMLWPVQWAYNLGKKVEHDKNEPTRVVLKGITHPQIHMDYYEWIKTITVENQRFIDNHSESFNDFNAIAMWVWTRSRETMKR